MNSVHTQCHTLEVTAHNQPAALERLLQVTRFRGFKILQLSVNSVKQQQDLEITLSVDCSAQQTDHTGNNLHKLTNQLNKLFDIKRVNLVKDQLVKQQA